MSKFKQTTAIVASLLILCTTCLYAVPFVSSAIFYDLFIVSDYATGTVTLDPESEDMAYLSGTVVAITITPDPDGSYTRYIYDGVEGTGSGSYTGDETTFQVTMNSNIDEYILWQVQYTVGFETSGISGGTGSATIVTIDGAPKTAAQLPFVGWYDSGAVVSFTYAPIVAGAYDLSSTIVTMTDASGHSYSTGVTNTHTVTGPATILSTYVPHPTTPSVPSGGSTIPTTSPETTPSSDGSLEILSIFDGFSETLRDFWETISSWASGNGGPSIGAFGAWFNGSTYEIPHMGIVLLAILGFVILLVWRRRRKD